MPRFHLPCPPFDMTADRAGIRLRPPMLWSALCLVVGAAFCTVSPVSAGGSLGSPARTAGASSAPTWSVIKIPGLKSKVSLALQPQSDATRLYVQAGGVFESTNSGKAWRGLAKAPTRLLALSPGFQHDHLVLVARGRELLTSSDDLRRVHPLKAPGFKSVAVAAFSPAFASDHTIFTSCSSCGRLAVTSNAGKSWRTYSLPKPAVGALSLLPSPDFAHDRTVFATVWAKSRGSLPARSSDAGKTWTVISATGAGIPALAGTSWSMPHQLAALPDGSLLAADPAGTVDRSTDAGRSWQPVSVGLVRPHYLERTFHAVYVSSDGAVALALANGVTHVSLDGGQRWVRLASEPASGMIVPAQVTSGTFALGTSLYAIDGKGRLEVLRLAKSGTLSTESGVVPTVVDASTFTDTTWIYHVQFAGLWPDESLFVNTYFCADAVGGSCPAQPPNRPGWQQVFSGSANDAGTLDQPLQMLYVPPAKGKLLTRVDAAESGHADILLPHGDNTVRSSDGADAIAQGYVLAHSDVRRFASDDQLYRRLESPALYDPPTASPVRESKVGLMALTASHGIKASDLVWVEAYGSTASLHDCADTSLDANSQLLEIFVSASPAVPEDKAVLGVQGYGKCSG